MQEIFLARQPILDRQGKLLAFELLFRSASKVMPGVINDVQATAQVLANTLGDMGIASVLGPHKGFINVDEEFLYSGMIELLPRQQVVIELLETITINDMAIARCHELKKKGFTLALDDIVRMDKTIAPLLGMVDIVKLDLLQIAASQLPMLVAEFRKYPVKLLAEKVEDRTQARLCTELGFDMLQGYFFARPELLSGKSMDVSKIALLQILVLMMSNAENEEIEHAFKEHPDLSYKLLRMVNSAGTGLITKIGSIRHSLIVMGRRSLQRWVQVLLYASGKEWQEVNPLMQLAATRGMLMELIARQTRPNDLDYADQAFMTGMLSLVGTLMGEPLQKILSYVSLDKQIEDALLKHVGELGSLLDICEEIETGNMGSLQKDLDTHPGLTMKTLNAAQVEALAWANSITV